MKKASIMTLILVLTATLFTGCRNMGGNSTSSTTTAPAASSSTKPTVVPMPTLPLPSNSTTPGGATNPGETNTPGGATEPGTSGVTGRGANRPSARGPRY